MKGSILIFISLLILLSSCDKKKQIDKRISGNWSIDLYEFANTQGFSTVFESSGEIVISEISNSEGTYSINSSYSDGTIQFEKYENGTITIGIDGESFSLDRQDADGSSFLIEDGNIEFINKTQLVIKFTDEYGANKYVLSK
jgi:hypothetical protein